MATEGGEFHFTDGVAFQFSRGFNGHFGDFPYVDIACGKAFLWRRKSRAFVVGVQPEHAIRDWVTPFLAVADPAAPAGDEPEALAEQALATGDVAAARKHLDAIPTDRADTDRARALRARVDFAAELPAVQSGTADLDALYAEGLRAVVAGANQRAAELDAPFSDRTNTLEPRAVDLMKASACTETKRSACTLRAFPTRCCKGMK